jgi:alkylated DNA nucleotide flippase Atl1/TfoX/Sxy family transcriptional regulator of competence genes
MSTNQETAEYIVQKLAGSEIFSVRAMFGEYALYAGGVVVGLICSDQLYVKDVSASSILAEYCDMDAPYSGAKDYYLVEEHLFDQIPDLSGILLAIAEEVKANKKTVSKKTIEKKLTESTVKGFMEKTFSQRVVELALTIPSGRVSTYGALARAAGGGPMSSQSIIGILGRAYMQGEKNIPFHRIVYSDGRIWISEEYDKKRRALYKKEGIEIDEKNKIKNFKEKLFGF